MPSAYDVSYVVIMIYFAMAFGEMLVLKSRRGLLHPKTRRLHDRTDTHQHSGWLTLRDAARRGLLWFILSVSGRVLAREHSTGATGSLSGKSTLDPQPDGDVARVIGKTRIHEVCPISDMRGRESVTLI